MDAKLVLFLIALFLFVQRHAEAEFSYNRNMPKKPEELEALGLKCIPGHTFIKIGASVEEKVKNDDSEEEDDDVVSEARRTHMNTQTKDETCKICVCSVEGKDEYCSRRPARNVNECIRMSMLVEGFHKNVPYELERSLSYRIRRDYIWHKDEIPYSPSALCYRGTSYYTNNIKADATPIEEQMKVDSPLDYATKGVCYYCVCSMSGAAVGCISRNTWFCDYYRIIKKPDSARDRYRNLFKQDRPAYFRQLSYRIRRTMDEGLIELLDNVGDELERSECVPFLSEYTDCSEANICTGCKQCSCTAEGRWTCRTVHDCPRYDNEDLFDEDIISNAHEVILNELKEKENNRAIPAKPEGGRLLDVEKNFEVEEELRQLMSRAKRSLSEKSHNSDSKNNTIKFYHTIDELNEDTLKNTNVSGTIEANKIVGAKIPQISRRTSIVNNKNISDLNDLHIEFNQPKDYDRHIVDNKIDSVTHTENKLDLLNQEKTRNVLGNYTQISKDKDLSKIVVNELKKGSETIGDKLVAPVSNITFTPENDTLTAMAFIAGNLLNKLWKMEKDSNVESIETEILKHEKIADLLDLFKEPLTMRQEVFIKNALERLSEALNKDSKVKNISLCEALGSSEILLNNDNISNIDKEATKPTSRKCKVNKQPEKYKNANANKKQENTTIEAISKINNVLRLINKYENIQKHLHDLRNNLQETTEHEEYNKTKVDLTLTNDESKSLNVFGNLLEKITTLLLPKKSKTSKNLSTKIRHMSLFGDSQEIKKELKQITHIDTDNLTLTWKDKLIIDYLNIFKQNSGCFFKDSLKNEILNKIPKIGGDIVDRISNFSKIRSWDELVDLIVTKNDSDFNSFTTTEKTVNPTTTAKNELRNNTNEEDPALKTVKNKFKKHLSAIIEDLLELQNQNGLPSVANNTSIANILPCIFKVLSSDNEKLSGIPKATNRSHLDKVTAMFESLKNNLKYSSPSRRIDLHNADMSQSSKIWERVIKGLNRIRKETTRRSYNEKIPKSYKELKEIIDRVDLSASFYKQHVKLANLPPANHLILLKTLQASAKQIENTLKYIETSMDTVMNLPLEERYEIQKFVDNAARSIRLIDQILDRLKMSQNKIEILSRIKPKIKQLNKQSLKTSEDDVYNDPNINFKLTRDQILLQLIKNRVQLYLRIKEAKGVDLRNDINYNVAKKIITHLESGNSNLAKELFRVFITKMEIRNKSNSSINYTEAPPVQNVESYKDLTELSFNARPHNVYESRADVKFQAQDNFLKQLLKLKAIS
ncbi:unnamed protein product [Parnassius apollo]|uniref:(apollo) hypothetical protein n=1 Tax=Parnassius apollo TaxID=110799 RepID=A0A8S3XAD8_PARAO|nr:unnamed protein product [Parnassius apollo]